MRTFKLTLAYDGTRYAGWQFQPDALTLQGTLEETLARITGQAVRTVASGRTDAGVHALGQVVGFQSPTHLTCGTLVKALNAELPHDMAVVALTEAPDGFHAIRDAVRKRYRYEIIDDPLRNVFRRQYAWWLPTRLDEGAMCRAALPLVGRHDFRSFETAGSPRESSERTVFELAVGRSVDGAARGLTIEVEADGFLYNMVRAIVGTLVDVGRHAHEESWPAEVLAARDRRAAGPTAPPHGLFLVRVEY